MKFATIAASALAALMASAASAATILPGSYDMPSPGNGSFAYQDEKYSGTSSSGYLSGGLGDLTDGVVPPAHWNSYGGSNVAWVGWQGFDPTIVFHFAPGTLLDLVTFAFDNSYDGGVAPPSGITLVADGQTLALTPVNFAGNPIYSVAFDFGGLAVTDLAATLNRGSQWTMLGEVSFEGNVASPTPEPASWAMMLGGFGAIGAAMRRRSRALRTA
jgi:opacity protein-like surface antigen